MFIRKVIKKNSNSDKRYVYYRLVESYRGVNGKPRQRVILNLGTLDCLADHKHKLLADKIEHLLLGQSELFGELIDSQVDNLARGFYQEILQTGTHDWPVPARDPQPLAKNTGDFLEIDIDSIEHEDIREVGAEWLCKQVLDTSGIAERLFESGIKGDGLAQCMIAWISRLVHPVSELATEGWLHNRTALCELYGMRPSHLSRFDLYKASLRLHKQQGLIETHLSSYTRDLFSLDDKIILYDLTNTYFEGRMEASKKARHGRSKEKRSDAPLITLALVVDHLGFPKSSRFYSGNISEPATLKEIVNSLVLPAPKDEKKPLLVIDAGISTTENLAMLRAEGYDFLCVSRQKVRDYDLVQQEAVVLQSKQGHRITVKDLDIEEQSGDRLLYVRSPLKAKKESSIKNKLLPRFEADMQAALAGLSKKRGIKTIAKVNERIGRIKERHPRVAKYFEIEVTEDPEKNLVTDLKWTRKEPEPGKDDGVYFLRTSVTDLDEKQLWRIYSTLTEVESAFRTLKTDLSIRPVYHQKDQHIEGHLFLGVIAYYIVAIIRHKLKQHGIQHSWKKIVRIMDSQKVVTTTFNDKSGNRRFIRQCSRPNAQVRQIYDALDLKHQPFTRKKGVVTQL